MAVIDSLTAAKSNLATTLASITANPQPTYAIDGQSVSWSEYYRMLTEQMKALNELIQIEGGPFELRTQAVT